MYVIISVNFDLDQQDPSLAVALYAAFNGDNWSTDENASFLFSKEFKEPREFIEKQIAAMIDTIAANADVKPFYYATIYSEDSPYVRKTK